MALSSPNERPSFSCNTKTMPRFYGDLVYGRLVYGSPRKENHCTVHPSGLHENRSMFAMVSKGFSVGNFWTEVSILIPSYPASLLELQIFLL